MDKQVNVKLGTITWLSLRYLLQKNTGYPPPRPAECGQLDIKMV
jgi:hypothetical protein